MEQGGKIMYVILAYDVSHHHNRFIKICREYLIHRVESSLDGELTKKEFKELMNKITSLLKPEDQIIVYTFSSKKCSKMIKLGTKEDDNILL